MEQLSVQLSEAISESAALGETLDAVRQAGYAVYLLLDCKPQGEENASGREESRQDRASLQGAPDPGTVVAGASDVAFRIDSRDLAFLRSLGIDPTRRCRARKSIKS